MPEAYIDRMTRDYWRRVRAALVFCEGVPTEELEGRTLKVMLQEGLQLSPAGHESTTTRRTGEQP